ncbi:MAG: Flp pilus assembly protein CpaB [Novosphingobium sp.]
MQQRNWILLGIAVVIGLFAVVLANSYFSGVQQKQERIAEQQKLQRIVVASQDMAFGTPLGIQNLRMANWPADSVPVGAFTSMDDAKRGRVALRPIVVGEPVLASRVSGVDGRATLSANLPVGKLAYTVPVNDVSGVGGFVRPGDRVDVILTRPIPGPGSNSGTDKMTDVILEGVPVLGIDQVADEKDTKAAPAKTATLEVDTLGAQKLALGIQLGALSLALRNVADQASGALTTVVPKHLSVSNYVIHERPSGQSSSFAPPMLPRLPSLAAAMLSRPARPKSPTMTVFRGTQPSEYEVKRGW